MTTPNRNQILERARELYTQDCYRNGAPELANVNPEDSELAESGFISVAKSELMMNMDTKNVQWLRKSENPENLDTSSALKLDVVEALASGVYISGTSGHGKTDLAMYISDLLREQGVIVIVIDSSQDWIERSAIPHVLTVLNPNQITVPEDSLIMDISLLNIGERQSFADNLCRVLYEHQAKTQKQLRKEIFLIFEESHVYLTEGALRNKRFQNITRLLTEGRNYQVRFMCITQFASLISKMAIKFMRLRFFGYADEPNDLRYISGFLGRDHVKRLRNLERGSFIQYASGKLNLVSIESYELKVVKRQIAAPEIVIQPISARMPNQEYSALAVLLRLGAVLILMIVIVGSLKR